MEIEKMSQNSMYSFHDNRSYIKNVNVCNNDNLWIFKHFQHLALVPVHNARFSEKNVKCAWETKIERERTRSEKKTARMKNLLLCI